MFDVFSIVGWKDINEYDMVIMPDRDITAVLDLLTSNLH